MTNSILGMLTDFLNSIDPSGTLVSFLVPIQGIIEILLSPFYVLGLIFGPLLGLPY